VIVATNTFMDFYSIKKAEDQLKVDIFPSVFEDISHADEILFSTYWILSIGMGRFPKEELI
jgi:hypothetical protein